MSFTDRRKAVNLSTADMSSRFSDATRVRNFDSSRSLDHLRSSKVFASSSSLLRGSSRRLSRADKKHHCTLSKHDPKAYLNILPKEATILRLWAQLIVVSTLDPRTQIYFRSSNSLEMERRRQLLRPALHIMHPFSILRTVWEHWMLFVFSVSLAVIPVDLLLYEDGEEDFSGITPLSTSIDFACLIDIAVTFFTGIPDEETKEVILSQKGIAKGYLSSAYFYMDFVSSVPSDIISLIVHSMSEKVAELRLLKCFSLIKIFRARTVFQRIGLTAEMFNCSQNMVRSIKYILVTALVIHWVGCLTYIIPTYWLKFTETSSIDERTHDAFSTYLDCIFRAVSLFLCIRSSNLMTINEDIDVVLGIVVSIFGRLGVAILIILFTQIFENVMSATTKYQEIVNQLESFMRHRQLPIDIQKRLITYYEYRFQKSYFRESEITSFLSRNILQQINLHCYRNLVASVTILRILPPETINEVIAKFKCEFFLPNDIIVKSGQTGDCMYFLASGTVCVLTSSGKEICHLESGSYFGEISLVTPDNKRTADVIAIEICEIYKLDKRSFKKLITSNEMVGEKVKNLSSIRAEQTKLIEEMHKKLIMTKLDHEKMNELSLQKKQRNLVGRPLNVKWNSKLWKNTTPVSHTS